jgi:hypothetical protein
MKARRLRVPDLKKFDVREFAKSLQKSETSGLSNKASVYKTLNENDTKGVTLMRQVLQNLRKAGPNLSPTSFRAVVSETLYRELARQNGFSSREEQRAAYAQFTRDKRQAQLRKNMAKTPYCIRDVDDEEGAAGNLAMDVLATPTEDLLVAYYQITLAHEMGHAIGLRHNFEGSYDKSNWEYAGQKSGRNYSSIMEYMDQAVLKYTGPGPYDAHALRAGYTGRIEVTKKELGNGVTAQPAPAYGNFLPAAQAGYEISVEDAKRFLGVRSWMELAPGIVQGSPIKNYRFCTDEDQAIYATCNTYDLGTTPTEVVQSYIKDYQARYVVNNFSRARTSFGSSFSAMYVSQIARQFTKIRQFLDKFILQAALLSYFRDDPNDTVPAIVLGMQFFDSVVRTPEPLKKAVPVPPAILDDKGQITNATEIVEAIKSRLVPVGVPVTLPDGKTGQAPFVVETKWPSDIQVPGSTDRVLLRGIEVDKMLAMQFLTDSNPSATLLERSDLFFSYPEFAKYILRNTPAELLPPIKIINEILNDTLRAGALVGTSMLPLPPPFSATPSYRLRYGALESALVGLHEERLSGNGDFSGLFATGMSVRSSAPANVAILTGLGAKSNSSTAMRFWAYDDASIAKSMIGRANLLKALIGITDVKSPAALALANLVKVDIEKVIASKTSQPNSTTAADTTLKDAMDKFTAELDTISKTGVEYVDEQTKSKGKIDVGPMDAGVVNGYLQGLMGSILDEVPDNVLQSAGPAVIQKALSDRVVNYLNAEISESALVAKDKFNSILQNLRTMNQMIYITNPTLMTK